MRRAAKIDANQVELVQALRQAGASVAITSMLPGFVDAVVGLAGVNYMFEFKVDEEAKFTPVQLRFHQGWLGKIEVVTTIEEALHAVGLFPGK